MGRATPTLSREERRVLDDQIEIEEAVSKASEITFTVPGQARAFARAGSKGTHRFTPKPQRDFASLLKDRAEQAMAGRTPLTGAVEVLITVRRPIPLSASKAKRQAMLKGRVRPTARPDADNHAKIVGDALNGICWHDDALITDLTVRKRYAELPGMTISVRSVEGMADAA